MAARLHHARRSPPQARSSSALAPGRSLATPGRTGGLGTDGGREQPVRQRDKASLWRSARGPGESPQCRTRPRHMINDPRGCWTEHCKVKDAREPIYKLAVGTEYL